MPKATGTFTTLGPTGVMIPPRTFAAKNPAATPDATFHMTGHGNVFHMTEHGDVFRMTGHGDVFKTRT